MCKFLLVVLLFMGGLYGQTRVFVSIAPQKYVVERVGGEWVAVEVVVPPGANSHTYEPSTKQMLETQKGDVWFRIGESFENRLLSAMSQLKIVDQREGLDLIQAGCGCCNHDAHDPHIWLSFRMLKHQAEQIATVLKELDPEHGDLFQKNLAEFQEECDRLDHACVALLLPSKQRMVLVSHPAFGYLCRDYGLEQLSIEMEGREPTPRYITALIEKARAGGIKKVFLQQQHNPKGGKRIAEELGAQTLFLDPYEENVLANIRQIAERFSGL